MEVEPQRHARRLPPAPVVAAVQSWLGGCLSKLRVLISDSHDHLPPTLPDLTITYLTRLNSTSSSSPFINTSSSLALSLHLLDSLNSSHLLNPYRCPA